MEEAYIINSVRSPVGKFLGSLSSMSATELASKVVDGLIQKSGIDKNNIDNIICGNVLSAAVGQNPAKQIVMHSNIPVSVPTLNVNMVCASGLRAVSLAAQSVKLGDASIVLAGGTESMSNAPYTLKGVRDFKKIGDVQLGDFYEYASKSGNLKGYLLKDEMILDGLWDCYSEMHIGAIVEKIGKKYGITREEQDLFALDSHKKAAKASDSGYFDEEIIPVKNNAGETVYKDEGIRRDTSIEKLASLKPAFTSNGTVTAGNSSQLNDGAAFSIVASASAVKELGIKPIAKIESYADAGIDPQWYGLSPIDSMKKALQKANLKLDYIDLIELNEAFAVQMLGDIKEMSIDTSKLNVNGGSIAIGHPIGASGARLLSTLVHAMKNRKKDYGIVSLCHGGGGSASMVVSRVD